MVRIQLVLAQNYHEKKSQKSYSVEFEVSYHPSKFELHSKIYLKKQNKFAGDSN